MSNYTKSTNFASKDSLAVGNPLKIVKGTEIDTEFNNIATAVATKADLASPTLTGVPDAPTASPGTNTTQLATTAFVQQEITAHTVNTSQIEDDAVTAAKIAVGAVGNSELATDAVTQAKIADNAVGTAEIIDANVTPAKLSQPLTLGTAVASTSGTAVNFIGIPSWAKRITVSLAGVSVSGSSSTFTLRIGSGSILATGYSCTTMGGSSGVVTTSPTDGFSFTSQIYNATNLINGTVTLTLVNSSTNTWVASGMLFAGNTQAFGFMTGSIALSGSLDRVRFTTVAGTDTFDAGSINIIYE